MFLSWKHWRSELRAAKAPGERNLEACIKWVSVRRLIHMWSSVLFSKVHPCQEHHQRNLSGDDEDTESTQLPKEWLRSLLMFWDEPWEKCMSKRASKVQGCRRMQDIYVFLQTQRGNNLTWLFCQQKCIESTLSDLTNIPNAVKYIHIIWIPSVSFCSGRLLTAPVLHVESWSTKTVGTKWASRDEARAETALPEGQQLSVITCTASQSAVLRCYRWRAWFVTRLGHSY